MDRYGGTPYAGNSYTERAIYDEIVANLGNYALEYEQQSDQDDEEIQKHSGEEFKLFSVINDHNYVSVKKEREHPQNVRQNLIDFTKNNSQLCTQPESIVERLIDGILNLLTQETNYNLILKKLELSPEPLLNVNKLEPDIQETDHLLESKTGKIEEQDMCKISEVKNLNSEDSVIRDIKVVSKSDLLDVIDDPLTILNESVNILCSAPSDTSETSNLEAKVLDKPSEGGCTPNKNDTISPPIGQQSEAEKNEIEDKSNLVEKPNQIPNIISELLVFAEKLKNDCTNMSESIDFNLEGFLKNKFEEYKNIIKPALCVDTSVQTENVISKKKLRKINAQDKRHLLESSNDSDSSSSSYIDKTLTELDTEYITRKPVISEYQSGSTSKGSLALKKSSKGLNYFRSDSDDSDNECDKSDLSQFDESFCSSLSKNENDNLEQTDQSSCTEKDKKNLDNSHKIGDKKDNNNTHDKSRSKSTNESDKENNSVVLSPDNSLSTKSKQDEDFQDKEIERLLNIKSLTDPQKNAGLSGNTKTHRNSGKATSKTDSLYAVMQELDKNSLSDDSIIEDSERILTEKQFLVKCNENLKQQLLDSASSDSDNFSTDIDMDLRTKSNDQSGDEDGNHISNVDKFLETVIAHEEVSPACNDSNKSPTPSVIISDETPAFKADMNKDTTQKKKLESQSSVPDAKQKKIVEKSLETILVNEKKQKPTNAQEDLIDLSGESGNSDIEEYPVEDKEKSQRIKPMLRQDQLESGTIYAQKKEADRLRRLEKRNTFLAKMLKSQTECINEGDLILDYASTTKKFIKVHPEIVKHLKPHQRDGVKFMYDCCYGCVDDVKPNSGSGCILAHCMGLGKTLQIIALLHTVISHKELKTSKVLVLCPKSTIMNWVDEIQRWLGPLEMKNVQIFNFTDTADIYEKINVLRQWATSNVKAGCLIMGYEAFRSLVFYHSHKGRAKSTVRLEEIRKSISKNLLKPGADLVVCDEGHIIKNRKSGISLAAAEIVTPKRIVLTGTPIQNNLKEYYSMVNFIKPLILGTEKEFANLYANPIKNGQHKDSSKRDIKVMKQRSFVLHKKLSKFVQRKEAELLQSFLPQKFEYVLFIPMTDVQNNLYEYVLEAISKREDSRGRSLITDYTCLRKIWTHPKVLEDAWKNAMVAKSKREPKKQVAHSDEDQPDDIYDSQTGAISVERDWWRNLVTDTDLETILPSNKLKTMFEIIRMSEENNEKCLIFSAFVAVLNVVEFFLNKINEKRNVFMFEMKKTTAQWINGQDYYRLDGKTNKTLRHEMVKRFNDPKNKRTRLFLISAKAGGQGINLIGANRVIILDTSWNPANDQQNIFRIFRLGQKKNCYVYRLIAMGTMEEKVYSRSVTKQAMSFRVVDEQQIDRHYSMAELAELYTLTKPCFNERPVPVFPQDQILANLLLNFPDLVYKYHEHDSLLENKVEQELSEQEKADAWIAYERDLQLNSEPREIAPGYHGYPLFGQGNYMYPMGDFDPNSIHPGAFDLSQLDMATKNALTSPLLPNYLVNRNSYLELLNMYKNFPALLNEKNRSSRFNPNFPMSLPPGLMNNPAFGNMLPTAEAHLSALANPFYPLHSLGNSSNAFSNPLSTNPMISNPNFPTSNQANAERFEANKNLLSIEESIASTMRNYHLPNLSFPPDNSSRPMQSKSLSTPPPGPPPNLLHSPTRQLAQNIFGTNIGKDGIPKTIISRKRSKNLNKPPIYPTSANSEPVNKTKTPDLLLRSPSPLQNVSTAAKMFEQSVPVAPVNMGIVYPKTAMTMSPSAESNEGARLLTAGSSMQIIPTHSPLADTVRKKFDNISPNISLTAVRTQPKTLPVEKLQIPASLNQLDATPSASRKRRNSLNTPLQVGSDREQVYSQANTQSNGNSSATNQQHFPPKIAKY